MSTHTSQMPRPSAGTSTGRVWELADELSRIRGHRATRAEVIARYQQEGGNYNTASTQYHYWKSQFDEKDLEPGASAAIQQATVLHATVGVGSGGRIVIPADIREHLGVTEGDELTLHFSDGELRIHSRKSALAKARALVRKYVPKGQSLADELIAERRAEAAREGAG